MSNLCKFFLWPKSATTTAPQLRAGSGSPEAPQIANAKVSSMENSVVIPASSESLLWLMYDAAIRMATTTKPVIMSHTPHCWASMAKTPPLKPIRLNVRTPATRAPSSLSRPDQPRSMPIIKPKASAASNESAISI